jgi:chemotaxis protein CheC
MNLDDFELDSLSELFNVGLHRAAASLSEITGQRIIVDMPKLLVCPIAEIEKPLADLIGGEIATVHQIFGGAVVGDAVLLIEHDKAALLAKLMTSGEAAGGGRLDQSAREVLAEIGNIVLGACLSGFGDMLELPVSFSVPRIHIESLKSILGSLRADVNEPQYAVIVATQFRLSELAVDGYMVIAIPATSLSRITHALAERFG